MRSRLSVPARRLAALALLVAPLAPLRAAAQRPDLILATTTSTRDAGLLDSLLPLFEHQSGYRVKVVAVGSGQALEMGRRGDADVVLSHAPESERALVDSGYFVRRRLVMHNDFIIVGPPADPAGLRGTSDAVAAFQRLAQRGATFVSRGDRSGTHQREEMLWRKAAVTPPASGSWYVESGQGMGATLQLALLVEGDPLLYNVYHVLELNPKNAPRINVAGGQAFADFLVAPATQARIAEFGRARFGRSLFEPDAGKPDRW